MSVFVPDYYKDFKCIADRCRHNCCIGWEIDIDEEKAEFYKKQTGDFGKKLKENIAEEDGVSHFVLKENERCPFLNDTNLCDIILNLGEAELCEICTQHPRFTNFYETCTETGLGLTCEEAARLIITRTEKMRILPLEKAEKISEEEDIFFGFRQKLFDIAQNRSKTVIKREEELLEAADVCFPLKTQKEWQEIFENLENLDPEWKNYVKLIGKSGEGKTESFFETEFEQLLVYFLYRHSEPAFLFGDFKATVAFSVLSTRVIRKIFEEKTKEYGKADIKVLLEIIRMYSSETEYSEENTDALFDLF